MRFTHPGYLLLLLPIAFGLVVSWRHLMGMARWRKGFAIGVRAFLAVCLVLALSGPQAHRPNVGLCTIFVVDRSDSISDADRARADAYIQSALPKMGKEDRVGVVAFGAQPVVDSAPAERLPTSPAQSVVDRSASDLGSAIRLAAASFPEGKARRIVLLTDGNDTQGEAPDAAMAASAEGIVIDHVPLGENRDDPETTVSQLEAPSEVPSQQPFDVRMVVDSTVDTQAKAVLDRDGVPVQSQTVRLNKGRNAIVFPQVLQEPGFHRFRATVQAQDDRDNRNNVGVGFVSVRGEPKVLLLTGPKANSPLASVLRQQGIMVDEAGAGGVPSRPEEFQNYDALVFNDFNANLVMPRQMQMVRDAVRDTGVGLAMIGGEDSFLPGGYYGTAIAEALPVDLDIRQRKVFPSTSILIVADTSGSMSMVEDGVPKVRLAAKAAEQTVMLMGPNDRVGVAGSTDMIDFVAPLQPLKDKAKVVEQIRKLGTGGGGIYVRPSLEFARTWLRREDSKVRHLILLADGSDCDTREGCVQLAASMRSEKISMSVVSIGDGPYVPFLQDLAKAGGGRFYLADKASKLPAIFTQDAAVMSRSAIEEGVFAPKAVAGEEILRGIDPGTIPPLFAYCLADGRPLARVGMKTPKDDPLLAFWTFGLGNSLAFMSDAQPRWAARWVPWDSFGAFWGQAARSILRQATVGNYQLTTRYQDGKGMVEVRAFDANGDPSPSLPATVHAVSPSGQSQTVALVQQAPGVFTGEFPAGEVGVTIVSLAESTGTGPRRIDATGLSLPYPPEYRQFRANRPLMERISKATEGKMLAKPEDPWRPMRNPGESIRELWPLFVLASLLILPFDIAVRRIALPLNEILAKAWAWLRRKKESPAAAPIENVERLQRVRDRVRTESQRSAPSTTVSVKNPSEPEPTPPASGGSTESAGAKLLDLKRKRKG